MVDAFVSTIIFCAGVDLKREICYNMTKGVDFVKADCHIHMLLDGKDWRSAIARHKEKPEESYIRGVLENYQTLGYTYLRDGGDRWNVGKTARTLAPAYGIMYRTPLAPLCMAGHYGGFIGETYAGIREYRDLVAEHRRDGADFIKLMLSGLMDFAQCGQLSEPPVPLPQIRELIHIAHAEGFSVMAHANGAQLVEAAVCAGVDSVEHGAYLQEDTLQAMAETGTVWVPTVSTVANLLGTGRYPETEVAAIYENLEENVRRFSAMGGSIAVGSDAGAWAVPHGCETEETLLLQLCSAETLAKGNAKIMEKF